MNLTIELENQLKREVYKASYYEFFKWSFQLLYSNEKYVDNFHVKYLCDILQAEVERIIRKEKKTEDIIINIPPRTSKSLIVNVCLIAWAWILDPTLTFITVSYDDELSLLNAQLSKDIINHQEFQQLFGNIFKIRREFDSKSFFMTDKGGFRMSKTTGANITGHKGVIIIVDDPQNPKTAESEAYRTSTNNYWDMSLYNRLTPVQIGLRCLIQQRLHQDDLTGHLLKKNPELYRHINLPAQLSDKVSPASLKEYYVDGLLDPKRLDTKTLKDFKSVLGSRSYSGQYDQSPAPLEGNIIQREWFDIVRPESLVRDVEANPIHFFIDSAYTEKTENDPTAILVCFEKSNTIYVLDVKEVYLDFPSLIKFLIEYVNQFKYSQRYSKIFIEPKASGISIAQQLRTTTMLNIVTTPAPKDDKTTRTHSNTPKMEARRVKLVDGQYITEYLDQLITFPNAKHDDMVDVTNMACNELLEQTLDFTFL